MQFLCIDQCLIGTDLFRLKHLKTGMLKGLRMVARAL